ncbi:Hypothetical_protein [Hexamita inflata]|uniref:Hypothetical_protein n=1 Tax=Hexamita inflata TaxID=28002 RepID=A0AA86QQW4_9EUKA|nr:Hypothetical protein HINF_LOCUS45998 [Hexamita inflata]
MPQKLFKNKALLQFDYELKQYARNKKSHQKSGNLKIQLSDILEGSGSVYSSSIQSNSSSDLSLSTDDSTSTDVFWDQSEVKDVKMLYVSNSDGKRSVQQVTISAGMTTAERSQDDLDIYDLLF